MAYRAICRELSRIARAEVCFAICRRLERKSGRKLFGSWLISNRIGLSNRAASPQRRPPCKLFKSGGNWRNARRKPSGKRDDEVYESSGRKTLAHESGRRNFGWITSGPCRNSLLNCVLCYRATTLQHLDPTITL